MSRPVAARSVLASVVGVTLAGCLGLVLAGCGSSDGGGQSKSAYDENGLVLNYPDDWIKDRTNEKGMVLNVHSPSRADRLYTRVTLFRQPKEFDSLAAFGRIIKDDRSLTVKGPGPAVLSDAKLADGTDARRIVTNAQVRLKSGRVVPYVLRETLAMDGDQQFRLTIFAPKDDIDSPVVGRIERSLRVPSG